MVKPMFRQLVAATVVLMVSVSVSFASGGKQIAKTQFSAPAGAEVLLRVRLNAPGYAWKNGPWDPPLVVAVDGAARSNLIPFRGEEPADYTFSLGPVEAGKHIATVTDPAAKARGVKVEAIEARVVKPGEADYEAIRHAPVLLGRDENTNSDVPLFMRVEESSKGKGRTFVYTVVWSNEDRGTPTCELMARYGRTVDIEWIYSVSMDETGKIVAEKFQGPDHDYLEFKGSRRGDHPILRDCTKNNMVCDSGESRWTFSYAPVVVETAGVRDLMLDANPWIYRVMYEELVKERKLARAVPDIVCRVDDPRRYALVNFDTDAPFQVGLEVALKLRGREAWLTADQGVEGMMEKLTGPVRVGIWTPRGTKIDDVEAVRFRAVGAAGGFFTLLSVGKLVLLDENFRPVEKAIPWKGKKRVAVGGSPVVVELGE